MKLSITYVFAKMSTGGQRAIDTILMEAETPVGATIVGTLDAVDLGMPFLGTHAGT